MKKIFAFILAISLYLTTQAQSYTWSENVACILYTHCTSCHHTGGIAPFSLVSYTDATAWLSEIQTQVNSGHMPPWPADPNYQTYAHERVLSTAEKNTINGWLLDGAPEGPAAAAPNPPVYSSSSELTSISFSQNIGTFTNAALVDDYRCFIIDLGLTASTNVTEIEILPGNRQMVHHVLIYADTADIVYDFDAADPAMGYQNFGGTGSNTSKLIGTWTPGQSAIKLPSGMGINLLPNTKVILQVHYPAGTNGDVDSTRLNLKYSSGFVREVYRDPILNHLDPGVMSPYPLAINPNSIETYNQSFTIPTIPFYGGVTVLGVMPHMHKVGASYKVYAIRPGSDTVHLVDIPRWDFHWQGEYLFRQPIVIPQGSVVKAVAVFDNTVANTDHYGNLEAINHDSFVFAGEATNEEMAVVYFSYVLTLPGDASIVIDTSSTQYYDNCSFVGIQEEIVQNESLHLYPNPSSDFVTLNYLQPEENDMTISILDISGKVLFTKVYQNLASGNLIENYPLENLPSGTYFVKTRSGRYTSNQKLIVVK